MRVLRRASAGYLRRHPWQLALALLGVSTGVAVIVAVDLANSSSRTAFNLSMEAVVGAATHQVVAGPAGVAEELYIRLRVTHGIEDIAPVVEGQADTAGGALRVLGVDAFAEQEFRGYTAPAGGGDADGTRVRRLLTVPGAVLLAPATADALGVAVGDQFSLVVDGRTRRARLVGLLPGEQRQALANLLVMDIAGAQDWLSMTGRLSRIDARLADAAAVQALRELLPAGVQLLNASGRTRSVAELSRAFMVNLTAMSLLALLVGVFLIYNSVSFAVLQRRSLLGVLRALGLTRAQTLRLILAEGTVLGLLGALLGAAAGVWLGQELLALVSRSINDLYFRVTVTEVRISALTLAKGAAAGLLATLLASAIPAVEAAAYPPRLALSRASLEQRTGRLLPYLAFTGLAMALLAGPLLAVSGQSLIAGLIALFLLVLGAALCIPWGVRGAVAVAAPLAHRLGGNLARLAVRGIGASLSRTGVAIVALAVAVSATIGVSVMVGSFRLAVSNWLDTTLRSDLYVTAAQGELRRELAGELAAVDGIADYSSSRRVWLESSAGRTRLVALRMAPESYAATELIDADAESVWQAFDRQGAVLVSESFAYRNEVTPGDGLYLNTARGERAFTIAGRFRNYDANPETVLISRRFYDLFWDDDAIDGLALYLAPGADAEAVRSRLEAAAGHSRAIEIRSNEQLRELSLAIFDRTFIITNVLYWLAVAVAIVGILGAMLALQMERAHELATLRALGVTRAGLGGMVTLQSAVLGMLSGIAALPLGLLMAVLLIDVINRRAFGWTMDIAITAAPLWQALALATGAALLAGLYPAWRAGRSRPARAMRED